MSCPDRSVIANKFAFLLPTLEMGGAERVIVSLLQGFTDRGYDIDLVVADERGPLVSDIPESIRTVELDAPELPGYRSLGILPGLVRYLRTVRPSSLLCTMSQMNAVALLARRIARIDTEIIICETTYVSEDLKRLSAVESLVFGSLIRNTYHWADEIVAVSEGVAADLAQIIQPRKEEIETIYNPIPPSLHQIKDQPVDHPWFDSTNDVPVVLSVGSMRPMKDFETLVRAFARVRSRRDARLVLIGDGTRRSELEELVTTLGIEESVCMPGFIKHPYNYMRACSVFAFPSRREGCGNVLLEALACGCSIASTDCPSGPAEILEDGEYGELVPVNDPDALAESILTLLDDPVPEAAAEARAADFSLGSVVDSYLRLFS